MKLFDFNNIFHVRNLLIGQFFIYVGIVAIIVVGFETDTFWAGIVIEDAKRVFFMQTLMEILTICLVPIALKMFKLKVVSRPIEKKMGGVPLAVWGTLRFALLGVPMVVNTYLYYRTISIAFAYMALIGLASMVFVYPSDDRIVAECKLDVDED